VISSFFYLTKNLASIPIMVLVRGTTHAIAGLGTGIISGLTLKKEIVTVTINTLQDPNLNVLFYIAKNANGQILVHGKRIYMVKVIIVKGMIYALLVIVAYKVIKYTTNKLFDYASEKMKSLDESNASINIEEIDEPNASLKIEEIETSMTDNSLVEPTTSTEKPTIETLLSKNNNGCKILD
jgi:hypothetical protein